MASLVGKKGTKAIAGSSKLVGINYNKVNGLKYQNYTAMDTINKYGELMNGGGWMSADDLAKYKSAIDTYTTTGNSLRKLGKYTAEEDQSWLDAITSLNGSYTSANDLFSQFADANAYSNWWNYNTKKNEYASVQSAEDFLQNSQYVKKDNDSRYNYINNGKGNFTPIAGMSGEELVGGFTSWLPDSVRDSIGAAMGYSDLPSNEDYGDFIGDFFTGLVKETPNAIKYSNSGDLELTDEEIGIYNYYYATQGKEKAEEYLNFIGEEIRQRKAGKDYNTFKAADKLLDSLLKTDTGNLGEYIYGFGAGVESGIAGVGNVGALINGTEGYTPSSQYVSSMIRNDLAGDNGELTLEQVFYDLANTTGNMAPSLAVGGFAGPAAGAIAMGLSSAGNNYTSFLKEGYGVNAARAYGIITGISEAGMSYLFSGIGKLGGKFTSKLAGNIAAGLNNAAARIAVDFAKSFVGEAFEEAAQSALEPVFKWAATLGEAELEAINWEEVGYSALLGGLSGGMLEGAPNMVGTAVQSHQAYTDAGGATFGGTIKAAIDPNVDFADYVTKSAQNVTDTAIEYANELESIDTGNKAAQYVINQAEKGKNISGYQINRLANEINSTNQEAVKSAVKARLVDLGEGAMAGKVADVITKVQLGQAITSAEEAILNTSKNAYLVLTESDVGNIKGGGLANKWSESILKNLDSKNGGRKVKTPIAVRPEGEETKPVNAENSGKRVEAVETNAASKLAGNKLNQEASEAMVKGYEGNMPADDYSTLYQAAYDAGKNGKAQSVLSGLINLGLSQQTAFAAYEIGRNSVLKSDTESGIINTESAEAKNESGEGVHLRGSVQRSNGKNTEGQVSRVESDSGETEGRRNRSRGPADGEAARLVNEGREVSVADLGIPGGVKDQKVYRLEDVEETASMKKARKAAEKRGLVVRFFAGDNLMIETKDGTIENVRGYIQGKYVYIRADHPYYTADQIMRHELGHDMVAKGEVAVSKVIERLKKLVGEENVKAVAEFYAKAYAGTGLTVDEVWEEVICDSLGDMNIFSGDEAISKFIAPMLKDIKQATQETKSKTNKTRGAPTVNVLYNKRSGKNGWGKNYTAQEALNAAVEELNADLWQAFNKEFENAIDIKNPDTPITDALVAVQEDVRQDTITPIQGAKLLDEAYKTNGVNGLRSIVNRRNGNLYDRYLEHAKKYDTKPAEAEGKASREIKENNIGERYGKEAENSRVLANGRETAAVGGSKNNQRKQGYNSANSSAPMANDGVGSKRDAGKSGYDGKTTSWLGRNRFVSQSSFNRFRETLLRNRAGLSFADITGKAVPSDVLQKFKDTIFTDENGSLLVLYHWTPNKFLVFAKGDTGFHFGVYEAAYDRRGSKNEKELGADIVKAVYLNIKNPILLQDEFAWDAQEIALQLWEKGLITLEERLKISKMRGYYDGDYDSQASVYVRKLLEDFGYDGIIYENAVEGKGTLSAVALYPDQIYTVAEETVSGNKGKSSREIDSLGNELTEEQRDYFKDTKVRDENGNLLVVYHGSPRGRITVFDKGKTSKINDMGQGHYFSSNVENASTYMGEAKGRKLYEVYLNITKPFVVSDDIKISLEEAKSLLKLSEDKYAANDVYYYLAREAKDGYVTTSQLANTNISQEMTDILIKSGKYDGIIDETVADKWGLEKGTKHFIALESNQIKSTANKNPTDNPDIRYSRELDTDDYSQIFNKRTELNKVREDIKSIEKSDDFKAIMDKISDSPDDGINAYLEWKQTSGYGDLLAKRDKLEAEVNQLSKAYEDNRVNRALNAEQEAIKKSGLSEADYFRKEAEKEFGYTPYYYDAGYILPNGKMLNFSGEKGKHFGTRGEDHRAIGIIYADTQGSKALTRFMNDGNIRIMAESPGLDIASNVEPSSQQYATIKDFIYDYAKEQYFNIDLSDDNGRVIGSLEYEGKINATRIINDIKHYYETGEIRGQSEVDRFRYSRELDLIDYINENGDGEITAKNKPLTNREILAGALESAAKPGKELEKLQEYKKNIKELNKKTYVLSKMKEDIKRLSFGKGNKDVAKIAELKEKAAKIERSINYYDRQLTNLEAMKPIQDLLQREKQKAYKAAAEKGREALKRNVEGRHKTAERNAIRKDAKDLEKLLNRGTKDRNIKEGEQDLVRRLLEITDLLFASDDELLLNGISTQYTAAEAVAMDAYIKLYEEYHSYDNAVTENKEKRANLRSQMNDLKKSFEGVLERERQRLNDVKAVTAFDALIKEYEGLKNSELNYIKDAYDADIAEHLKALKESLGTTTIADMTLEQLETLHKAVTMVKTTIQNSNKLFKDNGKSVEDLGNEARIEIESKGRKDKITEAGKTISKISWNNLKPVYLLERTGSKVLQKLGQAILDGESKWARIMSRARGFANEVKAKYGYKSWDLNKTHQFSNEFGQTFKVTTGQIMSIYAYSKRGEQALNHLRTDGFVMDKIKVKERNKVGIPIEYELNDKTAYKVSDLTLMEMLSKLTPEQKAYVDEMQKYLSEDMGNLGNEISMQLYGIKMFGEENYFPIHSSGSYLERVRQQQKGEAKIKNKGFTKPTQPHASNAIVLTPFNDVWSEHVSEMASYNAFTLPMEDFYKVYNYQTKSGTESVKRGVIPALENAYGEAAVNAIDQLLKDLNGGARTDAVEFEFKKLLTQFKRAKTLLSLSVVVQQPSAAIRAQAMIDPKFFVGKKIGEAKSKELWEEIKQYAPVAIIKEMGHFDVGMGRSSASWLMAEEYEGFAENVKGFVTDEDFRGDVLGYLPAKADEMAWATIWNAVKRETASNNPQLNTSSKEFLEIAGARFEDVIRHTQVYDSTLAKSANMRSKSTLMQMEMAFMAEPTTSMNMLEMALRSGKKSTILRVAGAVYASYLLNAILVALPYAMRDDDEDETFGEKYISALASSFLDNANPLTSLPFLKDVWSLLQGYSIERTDMSLIEDALTTMRKIFKGAINGEVDADAILNLAGSLSAFTGLPVANVIRDIKSIVNAGKTITREVNGMSTTWGSILDELQETAHSETPILSWMPKESKSDKLYDAIMRGDKAYVDRLRNSYSNFSAYKSAVRKALRDNDPRVKEAADAKNRGDMKTYEKILNEIAKENHFAADLIEGAIEAEANAIYNDFKESDERIVQAAMAMMLGDDKQRIAVEKEIVAEGQFTYDIVQKARKSETTNVTNLLKEAKEYVKAGRNEDAQVIYNELIKRGYTQAFIDAYLKKIK